MIGSGTITENQTIDYIRVEIDNAKTRIIPSVINLDCDNINKIKLTYRLFIPCEVNEDFTGGVINIPSYYEGDVIEKYIQAFLDELLLFRRNIENAKSIEQIKYDFNLELLIF